MKNKRTTFILSSLFTIILLVILILNVEYKQVIVDLQKVSFNYILPAFIFHFLAYFFRTWSFHLFTKKGVIKFGTLLNVHLIHNFYVHVIPASLGELSFPLLLKNKLKTSESLSILFISRFVSMLVTVILFIISILIIFDISQFITFDIQKWFLLFFLFISILIVLFYFHRKIISFLKKNKFLRKAIEKGFTLLNTMKNDAVRLKNPRTLLFFLFSITMSILSIAFFFMFILRGLDIELNLFQILFISSIGVAFILLPIKSIGGFGTTEGAWTIGLMLLGFSKEISISTGFVVHIYALVNVLIFFSIGLIIKNRHRLKTFSKQ